MTTTPAPDRNYRRDGVHGRLVHELGRRVIDGRYPIGDALPTETALVDQLGSGRSAIREAVKVLTAKGLVKARTKVGTVVQPESCWHLLDPDVLAWRYQNDPSDKQLEDLGGVRVAFEPEAARLAAGATDRGGIAAIQREYLLMEQTIDDPDEFIGHDLAFHAAIVHTGGNQLLEQLSALMSAAFAAARQVHTRNVRRNKRTLAGHRAVLDAIVGRRVDEAAELMRVLVTGAQHDIRRDLRSRPRGDAHARA
ncbi:FadR/GntR family transcriptional regulator [Rugosimonospora acidiphila]|uniref:FadR/GntR family transcriptional regulator n=1 Tax=Rugosimonospora acidiphila TaxID=556531 RepID=UPI0031E58499